MAIKLEEITTDITLEIDEEVISIADFQKATDSFLSLVKEVSKQVTSATEASAWGVKIYSGSAGIGVVGNGSPDMDYVRETIISGLRELSKGVRPAAFTDKAIEHSKSLAQLFKKYTWEPTVRVWSKREQSVSVSRSVAATADDLLSPAYEEDGSVDGILERVDGHGKNSFVVYDVIDDRAVKCDVTPENLMLALENFKNRVEVIGKVRYRKDGMPVSIKASRIITFPTGDQLPSLADMRKIFAGGAA